MKGSQIGKTESRPSRAWETARLAGAIAAIAATSLCPRTQPHLLAAPASVLAVLVLASRLGTRFAAKLLAFGAVVGIGAMLMTLSFGGFGMERTAFLAAKSSLAFGFALWLKETTSAAGLLASLARLGGPGMVLAILYSMVRQFEILGVELRRMLRARAARTFHRNGLRDWPALASLLAVLFIRSHDRGERIHRAMTARGWTGDRASLEALEPMSSV